MMWQLFALGFAGMTAGLAVLVVWQLIDRVRMRRKFAGIVDVDREVDERLRVLGTEVVTRQCEVEAELSARQHALDAELIARQLEVEAELSARQREVDARLARQTAEIEHARHDAAQELAETMRKTADIREAYASARLVYERLRAELSVLEQTSEDMSFGLYSPIFTFSSSVEYQRRLTEVRDEQRQLVRDDEAVAYGVAWTVGNNRKEGERLQKQYAKLMLRAFNGECEAVTARVTWNNATHMVERIKQAFDAINRLGNVMQIEIKARYRELKLDELRLEHELVQKQQDEHEEQRALREQQREAERVEREIECARVEAEAEEDRAQRALDKAYDELAQAGSEDEPALRDEIAAIEAQLDDARQRKSRAVVRTQQTRAGHVYILSNVGSFGDGVLKIGMTRRPNPDEHIQELGDASVPFDFDVHAMIATDDAPALEHKLHRYFHDRRVNLLNLRREFFHVTLDEIEAFARSQGIAMQLSKTAEAQQYRESLELRRAAQERTHARAHSRRQHALFPAAL